MRRAWTDGGDCRGPIAGSNRVPPSPSLAGRECPYSKSIALNSDVNWVNPNRTAAEMNYKPYNYLGLNAMAYRLGLPTGSVSANQYMDLVLLHEASHYNATIGNPDDDPKVMKALWKDCVKP
jgi:hypothetical protein